MFTGQVLDSLCSGPGRHVFQGQSTQNAIIPTLLYSSADTPRALDNSAAEDSSQAAGENLSPPPPPVFEISTWNHFSPLRETECDAVNIDDSIVRHFHATAAKVAT
ncbi:hypothetical protein R3I93_021276 [Phoxinus phoxinus]|uniref:Uncharacterized protein n=1 Tax=Phoxinus phoxinus TaxID=58324 RepID=A0AAN9GTL2_9TELE